MLWPAFWGRQKVHSYHAVTVPIGAQSLAVEIFQYFSAEWPLKKRVALTLEVQKLIAIADFGLKRVWTVKIQQSELRYS
jgi:hypothetical protein